MNWRNLLIESNTSLIDAMKVIDSCGFRIAFVVDKDGKIKGSVSDGDIRRGILNGIQLHDLVHKVMNKNPTFIYNDRSKKFSIRKIKNTGIRVIPIIDNSNRIVGIKLVNDKLSTFKKQNTVLIMAGGVGKRLLPLTKNCPKPLLKINGKPILEIIIEKMVDYGFQNFYIAIKYKAEMIKNYFGNGQNWNIRIEYIQENQSLGTAGAISLIKEEQNLPMIVINGDVISKVDPVSLLEFHEISKLDATMCVCQYEHEIPFGVVVSEGNEFVKLDEKPTKNYFVNAGIYVIGKNMTKVIPENKYFDMTELFTEGKKKGYSVGVFPITEYWADVGRHDDLFKIKRELVND